MTLYKTILLTFAILTTITPSVHIHAMNNNEQEEDHKNEAAVAHASPEGYAGQAEQSSLQLRLPGEAAAVAMSLYTPEHIEQANKKLIQAITNNNLESAQEAITRGANVNMHITTSVNNDLPLLTVAIKNNQNDIVDLLLNHNANIHTSSIRACTIDNQNLSVLNKLLSRNVDLNTINECGSTISHSLAGYTNRPYTTYNVKENALKALKMFAFAGANLTIKNDLAILSTMFSFLSTTAYSYLNILNRYRIYKAIALQDEYFKNLEKLPLSIASLLNMPTALIHLIIDYGIPLYTPNDAHTMDEGDRYVYDTLNRSIIERWHSLKTHSLSPTTLTTNRTLRFKHVEIKRLIGIGLLYCAAKFSKYKNHFNKPLAKKLCDIAYIYASISIIVLFLNDILV